VVLPKPLVPIGEYPVLELIVRQLARHQFGEITIAVNHQADIIKAFFGDGRRWGVRVDYSLEAMPLGTIGPLRLIPELQEHFLLMNGDVLTDLDLEALYEEHVANDRLFTIAATMRPIELDYGVLDERDGRLTGFREKPVMEHLVSMGIYVVSRRIVEHIPEGRAFGFDDLMLRLLERGKTVDVHRHNGYWLDIGRPSDYGQAIDDFERVRDQFLG
jgi:NDP-sugar pyrophosphorylase family protein